jgi:hypothetical protein
MVDRFLDWLKTSRQIPSNTFEELLSLRRTPGAHRKSTVERRASGRPLLKRTRCSDVDPVGGRQISAGAK